MRILSKQKSLVAIISVSVIFGAFIFSFIPKNSIHTKKEKISFNLPVHLKIPVIKVDSVVEQVGLTSGGEMDVPKITGEVAWFAQGTRPGEIGSAVIDGHYGLLKSGEGSVFDNLYKLRPGDKVFVEDDKGLTMTFIVHETRSFDSKADASGVFGSTDRKSHLNLITCEGVWNKFSKSYSSRLVVFTDKE